MVPDVELRDVAFTGMARKYNRSFAMPDSFSLNLGKWELAVAGFIPAYAAAHVPS